MNQKDTNSQLTQESKSRGDKRYFEIYNNKFIKVVVQNYLEKHSYHLNLSLLEPYPVRHRHISWQWLLAVIYFSIATASYAIYLIEFPDNEKIERLIPFIVVFILLTLGSLTLFLYKSPNVMEFQSRYGNCVLLTLLHNRPNKKEFKNFVDEIKLRSLHASQALKIDKSKMLSIEVNELRRLRDDGVLPAYKYEAAKARILKMHL